MPGGQTDAGAVQRAQLFRDVDELLAWKKSFDLKQAELIAWQHKVMTEAIHQAEAVKTIIEGCMALTAIDTELGKRLDAVSERIDIVNKRLRKLENPDKTHNVGESDPPAYIPVPKDYMGDGVYIRDEGFQIVLTTENGISIQNEIAIEPLTWKAIVRFVERVKVNHEG